MFDPPFRRRFYRVYNLLTATQNSYLSDTDKWNLIQDLIQETNVLFAGTNFLADTNLHKGISYLIQPDLLLDYPGSELDSNNTAKIQTEISNYHTVLFRNLNILDSLAVLYTTATNDPDNSSKTPLLREIFWTSITNRGTHLLPFMLEVNKLHPGYKSWPTLESLVDGSNTNNLQ